ncbi:MAG TPA: metallophosphoesterase, partial [Desulfuromonadales bacterium]|nr:metallophosphoesterase [Desulfuromonadales bacterium]
GNCEESLGTKAADCGCGFDDGTTCSLLSMDWYRYANERISEADRVWMKSLPHHIRLTVNGKSILIVHGGVERINRFVFPSTAESVKQTELDLAGTDTLVGGHSGIPGGQMIKEKAWMNAGAIGLPANDGTPDGWYLVLRPAGERLVCRCQRLRYPVEQTVRKMQSAGMVNGYAGTLHTGLWPSMDVLPDAERSLQGRPIELKELFC